MEKIKNVAQRLGIITVEDMKRYTSLELIVMIANKMNEFKETIDDQNDKIQYLLNEGLLSEVEQIFNEWTQDGTFDTLLNQTALKSVNDRIDETNAQLSHYVTYEMFGAKGDGVTDDYNAVLSAHTYANANNFKIVTNCRAKYLIRDVPFPIPILTDVDWNNSTFIIDDTNLNETTATKFIFHVQSSNKSKSVPLNYLEVNKKTNYIKELANEGDGILYVINSNKKVYIRSGSNTDTGKPQQEPIFVSGGYVVSDINWDFENITDATFYPANDGVLKIKGGNFITKINTLPRNYGDGVNRGLLIQRSNVVVENLTHSLIGEDTIDSKPYNGWLYIKNANNVVLQNTTLQSHKTFYDLNGVAMGNYDLCIAMSTNILMDNVVQINDIRDKTRWGIMVSNNIKDIELKNCILNRYDTHREVTNLSIDNCVLGKLQFIGFGVANITNTTVIADEFIYLRSDYGSSFNGTINITDCICNNIGTGHDLKIIYAVNNASHDYGYKCYFPNLNVKNFKIKHNVSKPNVCLITNKVTGSNPINYESSLSYSEEAELGRYPYIYKEYANFDNIQVVGPIDGDISVFYSYPHYLYCENQHTLLEKRGTSLSAYPDNNVKPNFIVNVSNTTMRSKFANDITRLNGSLIYDVKEVADYGVEYNNYRMIPAININNCSIEKFNLYQPLLAVINNSTIDSIFHKFPTNTFYAICRIHNSTIRRSQIYHRNITFDNVLFDSDTQIDTLDTLKTVHNWVSVIQETGLAGGDGFRFSVKMNNCNFNFDTTLILTDEIMEKYNIPEDHLYKLVNFDLFNLR